MSDFENLDYYELLGISRTASFEEIKRAYRREISKYHPDRFVSAQADQQAYAGERSQRLTEAYSVLSDLAARNAYNRGQSPDRNGRAPRPTAPPQQRDHQAELYAQALAHLSTGRLLQAVGALRQLQQINPFYRNSAELLAQTEEQLNRRAERPSRKLSPLLIGGGIVAGVVVVAALGWAIGIGRTPSAARLPTSTAAPIAAGATAVAVPTVAPEPTAALVPTALPTAPPATEPPPTAAPPTAEPATAAPTAEPTAAAEGGQVLLSDSFGGPGWATLSGAAWEVGYRGGRYHVQGSAGSGPIWSYRAAPQADASIGVDMQVTSGEGGLILRFLDANNYLSVVLNPAQTSYRVEQEQRGRLSVLAGGQSAAINAGPEASNRLVARLRGASLQVYVNDQLVADVAANAPPDTDRYGLLVLARDSDSEAFFDNLAIHTLE